MDSFYDGLLLLKDSPGQEELALMHLREGYDPRKFESPYQDMTTLQSVDATLPDEQEYPHFMAWKKEGERNHDFDENSFYGCDNANYLGTGYAKDSQEMSRCVRLVEEGFHDFALAVAPWDQRPYTYFSMLAAYHRIYDGNPLLELSDTEEEDETESDSEGEEEMKRPCNRNVRKRRKCHRQQSAP